MTDTNEGYPMFPVGVQVFSHVFLTPIHPKPYGKQYGMVRNTGIVL